MAHVGASDATVWEFFSNSSSGMSAANIRLVIQNRIKIETPFATTVYQIKISAGHMTLQEPGSSKLEFTRIRENKD
jgi:hypothetical protein